MRSVMCGIPKIGMEPAEGRDSTRLALAAALSRTSGDDVE